jgi:hypothetical protein
MPSCLGRYCMECVWGECPYQQRCRRLAQPCQHPRTEEQLTVLPPDRTDVQGSIQNTATTEDDLLRQTTSPTTKTDQDGTVYNLTVMGRLRQHQDYS